MVENVPSFVFGMQVPFTAKHPAEILKPLDAVVEPVLEIEKSVLVPAADEDAMLKSAVFVSPSDASSDNFAFGVVVPMPTFPR